MARLFPDSPYILKLKPTKSQSRQIKGKYHFHCPDWQIKPDVTKGLGIESSSNIAFGNIIICVNYSNLIVVNWIILIVFFTVFLEVPNYL